MDHQSQTSNQSLLLIGTENWKAQTLPLARIKKIMKSEEAIHQEMERERQIRQAAATGTALPQQGPSTRFMIAGEAPVLLGKACELLIKELTVRAWKHTERNRRRTLQRQDVHAAVGESEVYDFLIDIVPRITTSQVPPPQAKAYVNTVATMPDGGLPGMVQAPEVVDTDTRLAQLQQMQDHFSMQEHYMMQVQARMQAEQQQQQQTQQHAAPQQPPLPGQQLMHPPQAATAQGGYTLQPPQQQQQQQQAAPSHAPMGGQTQQPGGLQPTQQQQPQPMQGVSPPPQDPNAVAAMQWAAAAAVAAPPNGNNPLPPAPPAPGV